MAWGINSILPCVNFKRRRDTPLDSDEESLQREESELRNSKPAPVFTYKELKKATKNFKKELGDGGYGTVYEGELRDKRKVAVKELKDRNKKQRKQLIDEVKLLSGLSHENLITLYGFANTDNKLFLVYEFVPNGTVFEHLHVKRETFAWNVRVRIATETAKALVYLHSHDPQVVHRDVKPQNILLNNDFSVKVADFGLCRLLPKDKQVTTLTPGTLGYQDPEYKDFITLTDKSDVYSFGVLLMELISRRKAVDIDEIHGKVLYLDIIAVNEYIENKLKEFIDSGLEYESNSEVKMTVDDAAQLAIYCLNKSGKERPSMARVLEALNKIRNRLSERPDVDSQNGELFLNNWLQD